MSTTNKNDNENIDVQTSPPADEVACCAEQVESLASVKVLSQTSVTGTTDSIDPIEPSGEPSNGPTVQEQEISTVADESRANTELSIEDENKKIINDTKRQAEIEAKKIRDEAKAEAKKIRDEAKTEAKKICDEAKAEAKTIRNEANRESEAIQCEKRELANQNKEFVNAKEKFDNVKEEHDKIIEQNNLGLYMTAFIVFFLCVMCLGVGGIIGMHVSRNPSESNVSRTQNTESVNFAGKSEDVNEKIMKLETLKKEIGEETQELEIKKTEIAEEMETLHKATEIYVRRKAATEDALRRLYEERQRTSTNIPNPSPEMMPEPTPTTLPEDSDTGT